MNPDRLLLEHLEIFQEAEKGSWRLREAILSLAVRGKLVPQDPGAECGTDLIDCIARRRKELVKDKKASPLQQSSPIKAGELPFEVPPSWSWARLDEVTSYIQRGRSPKYVENSDIPVVSQKCIQWDGFDISQARFIDPQTLGAYGPERFLRSGDLLWNSTGTGTVGRVNVFHTEDASYEFVVADSHVTVIRPLLLNPWFIYLWIASPYVQSEIENLTSGSTNQVELNKSTVQAHITPIPPLEEQHRIVARARELLSLCNELTLKKQQRDTTRARLTKASYHALTSASTPEQFRTSWQRIVDNFEHVCATPASVEELRHAVLQLAVRGRLDSGDPSDPPVAELLQKISARRRELEALGIVRPMKAPASIPKNEGPFAVPTRWSWIRFEAALFNRDSERVPVSRSEREKRQGQYDYYGASGVIDSIDDYLFDGTLLLIGEDGANLRLRTTPIAFLASGKFWVNNHAHVLDGVSVDLLKYVMLYINSISLEPYLTGTAQPKLNQKRLNSIPIPLPPERELQRIICRVEAIEEASRTLQQRMVVAEEKQRLFVASAVRSIALAAQ